MSTVRAASFFKSFLGATLRRLHHPPRHTTRHRRQIRLVALVVATPAHIRRRWFLKLFTRSTDTTSTSLCSACPARTHTPCYLAHHAKGGCKVHASAFCYACKAHASMWHALTVPRRALFIIDSTRICIHMYAVPPQVCALY